MKWAPPRQSMTIPDRIYHDLIDSNGDCIGWIQEHMGLFVAVAPEPDIMGEMVFNATFDLAKAKEQLTHYFVTQRMNRA